TDAMGRAVLANMIFDARSSRTVPGSTRFLRDPFPGNIVPTARFDPVAAKILQTDLWPLPNIAGDRDSNTGNPRQNYADGRSSRSTSDQMMARIDHRFSQNDSVYVRYGFQTSDSFSPGNFPGTERFSPSTKHVTSAVYTKTLSTTRVNEVRFVWQREV